MQDIKKRKQVRLYLDSDREKKFNELASRIDSMSEAVILSTLVAAAIDTCAEAGYRMHVPLRFRFDDDAISPSHLNEKYKARALEQSIPLNRA